jgi:hypothetical protein
MLLTFDSISSSLSLQEAYRERGLPCALIPVPRNISSSCGYAAEVETEEAESLVKLIEKLNVVWDAIYLPCGKEYRAIYRREAL